MNENLNLSAVNVITHDNFGIGARFTLGVMSDDYIDIILDALSSVPKTGVTVTTDAVSSYVTGNEQNIAAYLCAVIKKVALSQKHVTVTLMFSRGCPGEVTCQLPENASYTSATLVELAQTDIQVLAQWSLYPLVDSVEKYSHMRDIYLAIDYAKEKGTYQRSHHFVTELKGDLAAVLETITAGWLIVGRHVQHVTTHATFSINSPTVTKEA